MALTSQEPQFAIRCFFAFAELPSSYDPLVNEARSEGVFGDPSWFSYLMDHYYARAHEFRLYAVEDALGRPMLLAPLRFCQIDYAVPGGRMIGAVGHPENYASLALWFDPEARDRRVVLEKLFSEFRRGAIELPMDAVRLWPLAADSTDAELVRRALRGAGFWVQEYTNSYNWYEDTKGLSYDSYFSGRSANFRYNVRRRQRALDKAGKVEIVLSDDASGLALSLPDYIAVSRASWKVEKTMVSDDTLHLIDFLAVHGALRLGVLKLDGVPVAAQFWIIAGGVAHCARLAYHEGYRQLAVGVVLTNHLIAHILDRDRPDRVDFGFGREGYKGGWMKSERRYVGFLGFNPATRRGLPYGLKNILGQPVKRAAKRVLVRLGLREADPEHPARQRQATKVDEQG